ncbi:MAG: hypothetical protein ACE5H0_15450 [Bacteroidota bacterium]
MNMGQTMLTLAALVLVSIAVLNANRMIVDSDQEMYEGEALDLAVSYAEGILEEIATKRFDENALDSTYQDPSEFTSASALGPESAESFTPWPDVAPWNSISMFDDVDDYDGYDRTVDSERLRGFKLTAKVYYVTETNLDQESSVQTYLKRVEVNVEHPSYLEKATFATVLTY